MPVPKAQLVLRFPHNGRYGAADFLGGKSNADALAWLGRDDWPDRRLALCGQAGCGKTHLLRAWAGAHGAVYQDGRTFGDPAVLSGARAFALDDADTVLDDRVLLHTLNTARDQQIPVLLSARTAPARWPVHLPDLSSRLRAIAAAEIGLPDDSLLQALLARMAAERQIEITQSARDWLLRRLPRSGAALAQALARLDEASLGSGKAVTRPFAVSVLGEEPGTITDSIF